MKPTGMLGRPAALVVAMGGLTMLFGFAQGGGSPQETHVWEIGEIAEYIDAKSVFTRHRVVYLPRLQYETRSTKYSLHLLRRKHPGSTRLGWAGIGGGQWVVDEARGETIHDQESALGRVPRDDLFALIMDVLRQASRLDGWVANGELMTRWVGDPRLLASLSEAIPAGTLVIGIYYDYWSSESPEAGYKGLCGFPGEFSDCNNEVSTVTSLVGRLVCDRADPWCEAVAWATVALPASLQGLEWREDIHGPILPCPEAMLAEIGWRCDLTRIPEETKPTGEASEPEPASNS